MSGRIDDLTRLIARLLLAACFVPTGLARAGNISGFAVTLAASGLPYPTILAAAGVVINLFGPLALAVGVLPRLTGSALALYTAATLPLLHRFWDFQGAARQGELVIFLAHLGIVAGLLLYAASGPGGWSWQGWRRGAAAIAPAKKRSRATRPA